MDLSEFLRSLLPSLLSVVTSGCSLLVLFFKLRSNSLVEKINKATKAIDREKVSDPKGYYRDTLESYVVVVDGKEVPLSAFHLKRKENLQNESNPKF